MISQINYQQFYYKNKFNTHDSTAFSETIQRFKIFKYLFYLFLNFDEKYSLM